LLVLVIFNNVIFGNTGKYFAIFKSFTRYRVFQTRSETKHFIFVDSYIRVSGSKTFSYFELLSKISLYNKMVKPGVGI
jgi:hypothetical protein